jgi:hypothetical protein
MNIKGHKILGNKKTYWGLILILIAALATSASALGGATERVSLDSSGMQSNGKSQFPAISADGRYVAFESEASNLVTGDTNNTWDIFVRDRQTGTTERVSLDSNGVEGNAESYLPAISADGRYVAFQSYASNLVPGDTNAHADIFVRDRQTGTTERVSLDSNGAQANNDSSFPAISADGRYVAFQSYASNLSPGDTNNAWDIFVHDRQTGTTERVSLDSSGVGGNDGSLSPSISADGRFVAFASYASNLVSGGTIANSNIYVHDRQSGTTEIVSVDSSGAQGNDGSFFPAISTDGRFVAFQSFASNLVSGDTNGTYDIFVHNLQSGATERVSLDSSGVEANDESFSAAISANGRFVAFQSKASNLVSGDTNGTYDIFVRDRQSGTTELASLDSSGIIGNSGSYVPAVSADGRFVAFQSDASNLVSADTNGQADIFVRDQFLTPQAATANLAQQVQNLVDTGNLSSGLGRALTAKLNASIRSMNHGNTKAAINQLRSFIHQVQALIRSGRLTQPEGQALIDAADQIIGMLGG